MSDAPSPAPSEEPDPPRRKKKQKPLDPVSAGSPVGGPNDGRPNFARAFPHDPEIDRLLAAFDAGDYLTVRQGSSRLARESDDDDVRSAARELGRRIDPDPMSRWMMAGAGALLFFLACWYWTHAHVNGGP